MDALNQHKRSGVMARICNPNPRDGETEDPLELADNQSFQNQKHQCQ